MLIRILLLGMLLGAVDNRVVAQTWVDSSFSALSTQLKNLNSGRTIERLVQLDGGVRNFVAMTQWRLPFRDHPKVWHDSLRAFGLWLSHYNDIFGYTGQFLIEAHKANPSSPFRSYTLFSTIMGAEDDAGLATMPSIDSALAYANEFPRGPFIKEVLLLIGHFYKDLYMVLRNGRQGPDNYKYDCYSIFIDSSPIDKQRIRAQTTCVEFYERALRLEPSNKGLSNLIQSVRNGTVDSWSYCAD